MDSYVKFPNTLILDTELRPSSKRVALALYACRDGDNVAQCSKEKLRRLSGCCLTTVKRAVKELESRHFIEKNDICCDGRPTSLLPIKYTFPTGDIKSGYSRVSRDILRADVSNTMFAVYLYLAMVQGEAEDCAPTIQQISKDLRIAPSTVCHALQLLENERFIVRQYKVILRERENITQAI